MFVMRKVTIIIWKNTIDNLLENNDVVNNEQECKYNSFFSLFVLYLWQVSNGLCYCRENNNKIMADSVPWKAEWGTDQVTSEAPDGRPTLDDFSRHTVCLIICWCTHCCTSVIVDYYINYKLSIQSADLWCASDVLVREPYDGRPVSLH